MTNFFWTSYAEVGTDFDSEVFDVVAHDRDNDELYVEFKSGGTYVYDEVPESTYNLFVESDSLGTFYRRYVSGKFKSWRDDSLELEPKYVKPFIPVAVPEPENVGSYGIRWTNGLIHHEPVVDAVSEEEALDKFWELVDTLMGTVYEPKSVRITAVVHYL